MSIPTADDFIRDDKYYFVETSPGNMETCILREDIPEMMIEFAKLHVQAALKEASQAACLEVHQGTGEYTDNGEGEEICDVFVYSSGRNA